MNNHDLKHCNQCKRHTKGYCSIKRYKVSLNANFCEDYKERLMIKLKHYLNGRL